MADLNLTDRRRRQRLAAAHAAERGRDLRRRVVGRVKGLDAVVGKPAARGVEEIVPLPQGVEKAVEIVADVDAARARRAGRPRR